MNSNISGREIEAGMARGRQLRAEAASRSFGQAFSWLFRLLARPFAGSAGAGADGLPRQEGLQPCR